DFIAEKDIRIGDRVMVKRAGEVIPYVMGPVKDIRTGSEQLYTPPQYCPICMEPVEHIDGEVAWYCVNAGCEAQLIRNIEHFVSRPAMDIVGLGIKIVEQLAQSGLIRNVSDLYSLQKPDLLALEGFGDKKAENLLEAIAQSKSQPLARLFTALGIRGVGEVVAATLASEYKDLDDLREAALEDLENIPGIGPNIAQAILDWFELESNQIVVDSLKKAGIWPEALVVDQDGAGKLPFAGKNFVLTGKLQAYSRNGLKEILQSLGGKVVGSVSSKTDYVVVGEDPGSKFTKAQELDLTILTEDDLEQLLAIPPGEVKGA
ncbi:MAG: helix-hairpin-helix domain-containing protein, partial [Anaerolineales bacterium]|nr:helix-hairpin-helix domain-containing protein [Anaerolineales bacterium]